ncbi:hypothetical protein HDIA_1297 [Hartmannibacter diazotrophicus]|uniref:VPEID-CTERM protein sorting domain protein n=1 Tax=Hartmannibacter diazotrophicus TaxID=1482074 RepID=A0A2C9D3V2_9HYPH|nr:hypothetical protein [Hartmannibacter diazotrophicus]SON54838.1 hypothetical protein HDIA_1297 [Hartmannibacter diazotrophicus]
MKKYILSAAVAAVVAFSALPAFAEGAYLCEISPTLLVCKQVSPPNGVPLPIAALGLPLAAGLFLYAKRRHSH